MILSAEQIFKTARDGPDPYRIGSSRAFFHVRGQERMALKNRPPFLQNASRCSRIIEDLHNIWRRGRDMQESENDKWIEDHPWLDEQVEIDDVLRYSLDEIRMS